jgi:hypothetical protein
MPKPERWGNLPGREEYLIPGIYCGDTELRIRVRMTKVAKGKKGRKEIENFSVGLEALEGDSWVIILRHCKYHEKDQKVFHTHNPFHLPSLGQEDRVTRKIIKKKTAGSQFRWSVKNMRHSAIHYYSEKLALQSSTKS